MQQTVRNRAECVSITAPKDDTFGHLLFRVHDLPHWNSHAHSTQCTNDINMGTPLLTLGTSPVRLLLETFESTSKEGTL